MCLTGRNGNEFVFVDLRSTNLGILFSAFTPGASISLPLEQPHGFQSVCGRLPWLRNHSSVQLGAGHMYVVGQPVVGQGPYAKVYEAVEHSANRKLLLKV